MSEVKIDRLRLGDETTMPTWPAPVQRQIDAFVGGTSRDHVAVVRIEDVGGGKHLAALVVESVRVPIREFLGGAPPELRESFGVIERTAIAPLARWVCLLFETKDPTLSAGYWLYTSGPAQKGGQA